MLKIIVLIKQIPFIEDANFDPETKTIRRDGPNTISAFDLGAIALAAELKRRHGAETTVATMGPPQAQEALRQALAMGMDRAVHLNDRAFAGSDTLATARALATWLKRCEFDLVLSGKYSLDAETGQVGPEVAELLGIAQITGLRALTVDGRTLKAERESDDGYDEIEAEMPALLTCAERVAPRVNVEPDAVELARSKPLQVIRAADLGADPKQFGFAGSPTWVSEIRSVETPKTRCTFIEVSDPARAAAELVEHLERLDAFSPKARAGRPISSQARESVAGRDVWVTIEIANGYVSRTTLELLSRADELATHLGGAVVAIGFSASLESHCGILAGYGADCVLAIDSPEPASYTPETTAAAVAEVVKERKPWGLFVPATQRGRDWGPRLAARLGLGLTGDAIGLEINRDDRLVALKPAFGGNIVAPILSKTFPQMATVRPGVLEMGEPRRGRNAKFEVLRPVATKPLSRLLAEHPLLDPSIEPLEGADRVVGIGTGAGGPEGVAALKELALVLDAAMCATRRVTDAGWVPRQLQVGLTGKTIAPRLYFAVGVRGVPNHTVGIKRARTVVAINNDPQAPIFERANFGMVADWRTVLPALKAAFLKRLG